MKRLFLVITLLAFAHAPAISVKPASAEQRLGPFVVSGEAQVGGRGVWGDDDSAKFEQYRDIDVPAFGALDFLVEDAEHRHYFEAWLDDIAQGDQEYRVRAGRYGRWGLRGLFSEIPVVFSNQAVSPYSRQADGDLELRPGFNRNLNPGVPAEFAAYQAQLSSSPPTDPTRLQYRTLDGAAELFYNPTSEINLSAGYRIIDREGSRARALGFGSPGGNYSNFAAVIDEKTHEASVSGQYIAETWNLGLDYTGSFFRNDVQSFLVDNPRTTSATESTGSTAQARYSLAPDNSAHLVTLSGAGTLPIGVPATLAGSFSWGLTRQTEEFVALTSNQAIIATNDPRLALPESHLDGRVQTIHGNLLFTARPHDQVNVKARYQIYNRDNESDELTFAGETPNDRNLRDGMRSIAYSYLKQDALAEATWQPTGAPVSATLGFGWERWKRDKEREVRATNEYSPGVRFDWRATEWARVRTSYTFSVLRGSDYHALEGALPGLRKYTQADYLQHRLNLLTQFTPCEDFDVNLSSGFDLTDYDDSKQGVTKDNRFDIGVDFSWRPHERVELWANYSYDYIKLFQDQGENTWDSTARDTAHNAGVGADFVLIPGLLDADVGYFLQKARAKTIGDGTAVDLPTIRDQLQAVTTGISVHPLEWLTFRSAYRWEKYDLDDYHEDFPITNTQGDIYLQNRVGDYSAHILSVSAIVRF